jgi:putative transposase
MLMNDEDATLQVSIIAAIFIGDLNVKRILEQLHNARSKQNAARRQFITLLKYKAELSSCHLTQVESGGKTKQCASCGVETANPSSRDTSEPCVGLSVTAMRVRR